MLIRKVRSSLTGGGTVKRHRKLLRIKPSHVFGTILVVVACLLVVLFRNLFSGDTGNSSSSSSSIPFLSDSTSKVHTHREDVDLPLPKWVTHYVQWHKKIRSSFPGSRLFTDPSAPPLLIRTCLGLCGGLNDRLGQLPWDLYLANQTKRVLLLHWHRPVPLENFLVPNEIDWTVPRDIKGFFSEHGVRVSRQEMKIVRAYPELFEGYASDRPDQDFWDDHLDKALERAIEGSFKDTKILRHRLLGHINEEELESRLKLLGETDMIHWTSSFGKIFHLFFRPSEPVQRELDQVHRTLNMVLGQYSAVHCRVRHPKATPKAVYIKGKHEDYPADKTGLPWEGETRLFAIETATHALRCARTLVKDSREPIYFFSDSNDLVRYISHELRDPNFVADNAALFEKSEKDASALEVVQETNVMARNMTEENAHIDRQKGREPSAYYATFVDLFLAVNARCITYGIGFYAVFATKISGTKCKLRYQEESWGGTADARVNTNQCVLS